MENPLSSSQFLELLKSFEEIFPTPLKEEGGGLPFITFEEVGSKEMNIGFAEEEEQEDVGRL